MCVLNVSLQPVLQFLTVLPAFTGLEDGDVCHMCTSREQRALEGRPLYHAR